MQMTKLFSSHGTRSTPNPPSVLFFAKAAFRVAMYVVFIAGSVPTVRPFFKKHFRKPFLPKYLQYSNRRTPVQGDDGIALVTLPVPPNRAVVSSSVTGKKSPSPFDTGDGALGPKGELGNGEILKTTRMKTSRASAT